MKCSLGFSYLVCIVFLFSCLPMVELCDNDPNKVYCDPKRRVWYDENAKATMQMVPGNGRAVSGTKVYENSVTVEKADTIAVCLKENGVTYDDFIRLINMELPQTQQGKCFLGCILYQNNLFTFDYKPRSMVKSTVASILGPILVTAMKTFGSRFIFSGDGKIYQDIKLENYLRDAKDMAIKCLKEMEELTAGMKKNGKQIEKCERMNEYLKCALNQEEFPNFKKVSYEIRQRKLKNRKNLAETPYADYCAAAFQDKPPK